ncbi:MAG: hypothetical protein HOP08_03065 [Cyclobacteriaceae bacterium]|nr:hypothetical protein [Cyclobacteriaceae bacterium]
MKKIIKNFLPALLCAVALTTGFAQTQTTTMGTPINDPAVSRRLQADLSYRNTKLGKSEVTWYESKGKGYYANYSIGSEKFLTRYDLDGKYMDTYTQSDWNGADVPEDLKTAYSKSAYKNSEVTGYWKASDPDKKGSYLELQNKQGKTSRVWVDEKGKFSSNPPKATASVKSE